MIDKINQLKAEIEALVAKTPQDVEMLRIKYLSKKGAISELMTDFRSSLPNRSVSLDRN